MGILNATPDSFSDGGRYLRPDAAIAHGEQLLGEGADLLDVGGESVRPGAEPVPAAEEHARVLPVIEALIARNPSERASRPAVTGDMPDDVSSEHLMRSA